MSYHIVYRTIIFTNHLRANKVRNGTDCHVTRKYVTRMQANHVSRVLTRDPFRRFAHNLHVTNGSSHARTHTTDLSRNEIGT